MKNYIYFTGRGTVLGVEIFDRYHDTKHGKSLAFHIRLGKDEATLSGEEADALMTDIIHAIESKHDAVLRKG